MTLESLTAEEARVLGTLLEKSMATPDYYPLTLNSLRTACNQKSSRDPVTEYDDGTVTAALAGLKRKCLATFVPYGSQGNQFKYRHFLEDVRFNLGRPELAVLAVLLLRGAQTLNEIRLRASSLHAIDSLEEAEAVLKRLAERDEPLAESLSKRSGWKEPRWRDKLRLHSEEAGPERIFPNPAASPYAGAASQAEGFSQAQAPNAAEGSAQGEIAELRREVADLRMQLESMREVVDRIRAELF